MKPPYNVITWGGGGQNQCKSLNKGTGEKKTPIKRENAPHVKILLWT